MKAPITTAQAMNHPDVVLTINTLGKMADELRAENEAQRKVLEQALDFIKTTNKSSQFLLVPASNLNKAITAIEGVLKS